MEQLLNKTFKIDNTNISTYHMTDERRNSFKLVTAKWESGNIRIYVSADYNKYNIICNKHPEATSNTRTMLFITFIDNEKSKIENRYILDTCDYDLKVPKLSLDAYAGKTTYQLFQDTKGYYEILADIESLLINNPKMDETTLKILSYTLEQMRSETPDYHTCPDYLANLINQGYKKSKQTEPQLNLTEKE